MLMVATLDGPTASEQQPAIIIAKIDCLSSLLKQQQHSNINELRKEEANMYQVCTLCIHCHCKNHYEALRIFHLFSTVHACLLLSSVCSSSSQQASHDDEANLNANYTSLHYSCV